MSTKASKRRLDAAVREAARAIARLSTAPRAQMLAALESSENPLDRTIAAEARRMLAPAQKARTI